MVAGMIAEKLEKKAERLLEEKMAVSKDGTIYLNDTDMKTIIEVAREEDNGNLHFSETGGELEMNTYYIGGSPCAGKSSVAEILSKKHDLYYFKTDDFLDRYMQTGARKGYPVCRKVTSMNAEQVWMREPIIQCREEFDIYREIFEFVATDLKQIDWKGGIITEGTAYLPELMKQSGISGVRYISITPAKEFQISRYRKRNFVPLVLEGCSDKEKAFCNWMDRDILFAQEVRRQCHEENYVSVINDGTMELKELADMVATHFELK